MVTIITAVVTFRHIALKYMPVPAKNATIPVIIINDKITGDSQICPYEGCSGDTILDAKKWAGKEPPERGVRYSPYPLIKCKQGN